MLTIVIQPSVCAIWCGGKDCLSLCNEGALPNLRLGGGRGTIRIRAVYLDALESKTIKAAKLKQRITLQQLREV